MPQAGSVPSAQPSSAAEPTAAPAGNRRTTPGGPPAFRFAVLPLSDLDLGVADSDHAPSEQTAASDRELEASLKGMGVLQPLVVRPELDAGRYLVLAGKRALPRSQGGRPHRGSVLRGRGRAEPGDRRPHRGFTENKVRLEMTPWDTAVALERVIEATGLTQREVAKRFGLSPGTVSEYLQLVRRKLPEKKIAQLAAGKVEREGGAPFAQEKPRGHARSRSLTEAGQDRRG